MPATPRSGRCCAGRAGAGGAPAGAPASHPRPTGSWRHGRLWPSCARVSARAAATLFYGDESGFCLQPTLGRCWQPPGPTLSLPAQAHSRRWNVCGFLRGDGESAHAGRVGRLGAAEFIDAVETRLLPILRRPSVLVLDNGPCHRARLVQAQRAAWRTRGLRLFFLPPYCPHLNRIETLWRRLQAPLAARLRLRKLRHAM